MTTLSHSAFLQALGWAIANSLWQMALLWAVYQLGFILIRKASAAAKTATATGLLLAGFAWFVTSLTQHYNQLHASPWLLSDQAAVFHATIPVDKTHSHNFGYYLQVAIRFCNNWLPFLSAAYLLVLGFLLLRLSKAYRLTQAVRHTGLVRIDATWRVYVQQMALQIGLKKEIRIWLSELVDVPATMGYLKPLILLPIASFNNLTTQQVEAIILHELAHIKRNDYLLNLLITVVETILFFNPFAQLMARHIKQERENSCDDFVLQFRYNPHTYASALLSLEQQRMGIPEFAMAAQKNKTDLLDRIKRIMNVPSRPMNYGQKLIALLVTAVIMTSLAWLSPGQNSETTGPSPANLKIAESNRLQLFPRVPSLLAFEPGGSQHAGKQPAPHPTAAVPHNHTTVPGTMATPPAQDVAATATTESIDEAPAYSFNNIDNTNKDDCTDLSQTSLNAGPMAAGIQYKPMVFHFQMDTATWKGTQQQWQLQMRRSMDSAQKLYTAYAKRYVNRDVFNRQQLQVTQRLLSSKFDWKRLNSFLLQQGHTQQEATELMIDLRLKLEEIKQLSSKTTMLDSLQTDLSVKLTKLREHVAINILPRAKTAPSASETEACPDVQINPAPAVTSITINGAVATLPPPRQPTTSVYYNNNAYRERVRVMVADTRQVQAQSKAIIAQIAAQTRKADCSKVVATNENQPSYSTDEAAHLAKALAKAGLLKNDKPYIIARGVNNVLLINGQPQSEETSKRFVQIFNGRNFYILSEKNKLEIGVN